jgi:hypothetical protein
MSDPMQDDLWFNPQGMTPAQVATLFSNYGGHAVTEPKIMELIESGCPTNPDGNLHLLRFLSWLIDRG